MKIERLPDDTISSKSSDELQKFLLDRVVKLRKLNKEMAQDPKVQKAQDALIAAKLPFKKAKSKWIAEIEVVELELKSRDIKFNIKWDDIYEDE